MKYSIDIDFPIEKMELRRKRLEARLHYQIIDRVPVGFCLVARYFTPLFGINYQDFFKDAETQFYCQLQFAKYYIENIPDDTLCTSPTITVNPFFDNVVNASAFGARIEYPDNETLQACPVIKTVDQMERVEIPSTTSGLWGKLAEWWLKMKALTAETTVTFNGVKGKVEMGTLLAGGEGPHMIAIDLVGQDFYWWLLEYPEACHRFLEKIARGIIQANHYFKTIDPRPLSSYGVAEDSSQIMSADLFKRFTIPYDRRLFEEFGQGLVDGRGMHMCGDSTHLHQVLMDDLHISSFNVFGYRVPPQVAARNLKGIYLWGNVNPMLMLKGSKTEVKQAAMECLQAMAPLGGFMLGDGANVCPGTPLENLVALTEAAEEYGIPELAP